MATTFRTLPEGVPPEGLKILRAESEEDLEREFAKWAGKGYIPARHMEVGTHYDEESRQWRVLYVLPLWNVSGETPSNREAYQ